MPRAIPGDRIRRLVEVATDAFIEQGFRHTRMDEVAETLGVAKGTVYLYVESKEALFDLVCRSADVPFVAPIELPIKTPPPGSTVQFIGERLAAGQVMPALGEALGGQRRRRTVEELTAIVENVYDALFRNRVGIKVVDRSARDIPELGQLWFGGARGFLVGALEHYLGDRVHSRRLRPIEETAVAARFIVETCAFWAVHRHWDVAPLARPEEAVRTATIELVTSALLLEPKSKPARAPRQAKRR